PSTAAALKLDVDRPATNLLAGARYLKRLLDEFHSTDLALAAYNAGPTAVADAGGAPTQETLDYVANVTSLWRELRGCRGSRSCSSSPRVAAEARATRRAVAASRCSTRTGRTRSGWSRT